MKSWIKSLSNVRCYLSLLVLTGALLISLFPVPAWATDLAISQMSHKDNLEGVAKLKYMFEDKICITVNVDNTSTAGGGPYDSPDTKITVILPDGVTFDDLGTEYYSAEFDDWGFTPWSSDTYTLKGKQVTIDLATLKAGESKKVIVRCTAVKNGTFTATATVSGILFDPESTNNGKECSFTIEVHSGTLQFSAAGYTVNENAGTATITVTRTDGSEGAASVDYATSDGTAKTVEDYIETSGTLTWADGNGDPKTFSVPIVDEATFIEENETVNLTLSNPTGADPGTQMTAVISILDDENETPHPGIIEFSADQYTVNENSGQVTITVERNSTDDGFDGTVSVNYATHVETATVNEDYKPQSGTMTWGDKQNLPQSFTIPIVDDTEAEEDEIVRLVLSNPTGGAVLESPSTVTLTIVDDDDEDSDGISGQEEDASPNGGDGNNNQVLDSEEENVASFLLFETNDYCTLSSQAGTVLKRVEVQDIPSWDDRPLEADYPCGFIEFSVDGMAAGGCTEVTMILPLDETINSYYKYGPTQNLPQDHWYEFLFNGQTGAEIFHETDRTRIVLYLCDGQRGDHDLDANGEIVDPGGPATVYGSGTTLPATDGDSSTCFISTISAQWR